MWGKYFYRLVWFSFIYQITTTNGFTLPFSSFASSVVPRRPSNSTISSITKLPKVSPLGNPKEHNIIPLDFEDSVSKASTDLISILPQGFVSSSSSLFDTFPSTQGIASTNTLPFIPETRPKALDYNSILSNVGNSISYLPSDSRFFTTLASDSSILNAVSSPLDISNRNLITTGNEFCVNSLGNDVATNYLNSLSRQFTPSADDIQRSDINNCNVAPISKLDKTLNVSPQSTITNNESKYSAIPSPSVLQNEKLSQSSFVPSLPTTNNIYFPLIDATQSSSSFFLAQDIHPSSTVGPSLSPNSFDSTSFSSINNPFSCQISQASPNPSLSLVPKENLPQETKNSLSGLKFNAKSLDLKIMPLPPQSDGSCLQGVVRPLIRNKTSNACLGSSVKSSTKPGRLPSITKTINNEAKVLSQPLVFSESSSNSQVSSSSSSIKSNICPELVSSISTGLSKIQQPVKSIPEPYPEASSNAVPSKTPTTPSKVAQPIELNPSSYINQNSFISTPKVSTVPQNQSSPSTLNSFPVPQKMSASQILTLPVTSNYITSQGCPTVQEVSSSPYLQTISSPTATSFAPTFISDQSLKLTPYPSSATLNVPFTNLPKPASDSSNRKVSSAKLDVTPAYLIPDVNMLKYLQSLSKNECPSQQPTQVLTDSPLNLLPPVALNEPINKLPLASSIFSPSQLQFTSVQPISLPLPSQYSNSLVPLPSLCLIDTANSFVPVKSVIYSDKALPVPNILPLLSYEPNTPSLFSSLPNINIPISKPIETLLQNPFKKLTPVLNAPELSTLQTVSPVVINNVPSFEFGSLASDSYLTPSTPTESLNYSLPPLCSNIAFNSQTPILGAKVKTALPITAFDSFITLNTLSPPSVNSLPQVISIPETCQSGPSFVTPLSTNFPAVNFNTLPEFVSSSPYISYASILEAPKYSTTILQTNDVSSSIISSNANDFNSVSNTLPSTYDSPLSIANVVDLVAPTLLSIKIPSLSDCDDISSLPVLIPDSSINSIPCSTSSNFASKLTNTMIASSFANLTSLKAVPSIQSIPVVSVPKVKLSSRRKSKLRRHSSKSKSRKSLLNMMVASPSESSLSYAEPLNKTSELSTLTSDTPLFVSLLSDSSEDLTSSKKSFLSSKDLSSPISKHLEPANDETTTETQFPNTSLPPIKKRSSSKTNSSLSSNHTSSSSLSNDTSSSSNSTSIDSSPSLTNSSLDETTSSSSPSNKLSSEMINSKNITLKTAEEIVEYIILKELLDSNSKSNWSLLEKIIDILCAN